ncbi:unnamed protein product [Schistocephalus solidus]|uniref:Cadherin domain-containing protein n=1 Tax=Schistocephalus solidus TaxID=70667 RepID=A0A183SU11_SCHSO|nr:unnamed protein product [Schistocephalus solidus]
MQSEPHLGDDGAVIHPTIGITDRLGYQHVLSISPPDKNIIQQLTAPRPTLHLGGLLLRRKAGEGGGQQETVFRIDSQKEAVIVTVTDTMGTQHSLPGSVLVLVTAASMHDLAGLDMSRIVLSMRDDPRQQTWTV